MLALKDLLERADSLLERNQPALVAGKDLGNGEGLGHETLDLASTLDSELILLQIVRPYQEWQ